MLEFKTIKEIIDFVPKCIICNKAPIYSVINKNNKIFQLTFEDNKAYHINFKKEKLLTFDINNDIIKECEKFKEFSVKCKTCKFEFTFTNITYQIKDLHNIAKSALCNINININIKTNHLDPNYFKLISYTISFMLKNHIIAYISYYASIFFNTNNDNHYATYRLGNKYFYAEPILKFNNLTKKQLEQKIKLIGTFQ